MYYHKNHYLRLSTFVHVGDIAVETPAISASNSATSYEISGTSVTLSCVSASDSSGSGAYVWKLGGQKLYVLSGFLA